MNKENEVQLGELLDEGKEKFRPINSHNFKSHTMKVVGEVEDGVYAIIMTGNKNTQQDTAHFFAYSEKVLPDETEEKIDEFKEVLNSFEKQAKNEAAAWENGRMEDQETFKRDKENEKEILIDKYKQALEK